MAISYNYKDFHVFGCPVYALNNKLAGGSSVPHWNPCAHIRLNLGFSSQHARTVYNVLNLQTGTVSPQFHVKYDDFFTSMASSDINLCAPSFWQAKAGFTTLLTQQQTFTTSYSQLFNTDKSPTYKPSTR